MSAPVLRHRCFYCRNHLFTHQERPGVQPGNLLTRDHIIPKQWRTHDTPEGIRITRRCCHACNQLRALAGHCPAVLHIVRDLKRKWHMPRARDVVAVLRRSMPQEAPNHG